MKAKVSRGGGFRGVLNYVFDVGNEVAHTKNAERVAGNLVGNDPCELSREFSAVRRLRPDIGKPVWHCSLSLPPGDCLSADKWEVVAGNFMQYMGFDLVNTPWVAVRHQDTDKDHIHIVASRVGLNGKVWLGQWEARRSIEATQKLECTHDLTLTPGLGDARAERRSLTSKEINMAVRTGDEPIRQRLQRLVGESMKDNPSVIEFAERLRSAGVGARANVASTGRMNGFSFEMDGISFKGSDLGKGYTWRGLQKAGVTYDEVRDRAGLERFRSSITDRGERQNIATGREHDARGSETSSGCNFERDGTGLRASSPAQAECDASAGSLRRGDRDTAQDTGRTDARNEYERSAGIRAESRETGTELIGFENQLQQHRADSSTGDNFAGKAGNNTEEHEQGSWGAGQSSIRDTSKPLATGVGADSGRNAGGNASREWSSRFRQASAAKRRATDSGLGANGVEQSHLQGTRVDAADNKTAREIDPSAYLQASGYTVKREGRHLSVRTNGDEMYRITRKDDGRWLWCDRYGNNGGDNVDLVREIEPGTGYAEAVYRLSGAPIVRMQPCITAPKRQPPQLPKQELTNREHGRKYIQRRGIILETIEYAEKAGVLRYTDGGILFVGYDRAGVAQNITRRAINLADPIQKRDLRGSDKSYPPILPGDPTKVWIVEGGMDALALHDLAKRNGQQPPTVIVSGGANVRSFLERPKVQATLKQAERVTVCGENEKNNEAQIKSDTGHLKQMQRVREITGNETRYWKPEKDKNLAELNARQVAEVKRKRRRVRSRDYDLGR